MKSDIISSEETVSFEDMINKYSGMFDLSLGVIEHEIRELCDKVLKARDFMAEHVNEIETNQDIEFDKWVEKHDLDISEYDYDFLEMEYEQKKEKKMSDMERLLRSPRSFKTPFILPIPEQRELDNLADRIRQVGYEISITENDISNLEERISAFSYLPNLGRRLLILVCFAFFSVVLPVLIIILELFSVAMKVFVFVLFSLGLAAVFTYVWFQIKGLKETINATG